MGLLQPTSLAPQGRGWAHEKGALHRLSEAMLDRHLDPTHCLTLRSGQGDTLSPKNKVPVRSAGLWAAPANTAAGRTGL